MQKSNKPNDPGSQPRQGNDKDNKDQRGKDKKVDKSTPHNFLTREDIPESTNEPDGVPGSGKRQDTN